MTWQDPEKPLLRMRIPQTPPLSGLEGWRSPRQVPPWSSPQLRIRRLNQVTSAEPRRKLDSPDSPPCAPTEKNPAKRSGHYTVPRRSPAPSKELLHEQISTRCQTQFQTLGMCQKRDIRGPSFHRVSNLKDKSNDTFQNGYIE